MAELPEHLDGSRMEAKLWAWRRTRRSCSFDELAQVVAPDVVDHNAVIFMQPEGSGGVEEGVRMLLQGFPDLRLTTQELLAEGDQVVARCTMSGTNTGD